MQNWFALTAWQRLALFSLYLKYPAKSGVFLLKQAVKVALSCVVWAGAFSDFYRGTKRFGACGAYLLKMFLGSRW